MRSRPSRILFCRHTLHLCVFRLKYSVCDKQNC